MEGFTTRRVTVGLDPDVNLFIGPVLIFGAVLDTGDPETANVHVGLVSAVKVDIQGVLLGAGMGVAAL